MSGDPSTGIFLRANSYTCTLKHVDAELSGKFWGKSCNDTWSTIHKLDIYCTQEVDIYFGLFIRYLLNFSALEYFFQVIQTLRVDPSSFNKVKSQSISPQSTTESKYEKGSPIYDHIYTLTGSHFLKSRFCRPKFFRRDVLAYNDELI